jgi:hypothetical protein
VHSITAEDLIRLEGLASRARTAADLDPLLAEARRFPQDDFRDGFILKTLRLQHVLLASAARGDVRAPIPLGWGAR